jgi:regulator of protease activity HflC (stomatin/prohibitin superfamily)
MEPFILFVLVILGGSTLAGSVKIVKTGDQALVENLGTYKRKLDAGVNFLVPFLDRVVFQDTLRERVLDIPPQTCITRDNVSITVDAVLYWQIMDMAKLYYKIQNIQSSITNLVLTQIRAEVGKMELDETFTARSKINAALLEELDEATDPWGVKVTRVELRDIVPAKAVQDAMELQMSAERKRRAAILTSEGEREAAINSARGKAEAQVLAAESEKKAIVLRAQADREQQVLRAQSTAESIKIIANTLKDDPHAAEALKFMLAQNYFDMGTQIGLSGSSKVLFMDPNNIPATIEGMKSVIAGSR